MTSPTRRLLDWVYPPRCRACGRPGPKPVCAACREALVWLDEPRCRRCGLPLDPLAMGPTICRHCRSERRPALSVARSAVAYGGPVRELVRRFKFHRREAVIDGLAWILAEWLERDPAALAAVGWDRADALVPVPLHRWRRWWRGFNQAERLAAELRRLGGPPVLGLLERIRATRPQVGLNPAQRRRNVAGAFASKQGDDPAGRRVILIDDLYTTGATLAECARTLRAAGVTEVTALCLAQRTDDEWAPRKDTPAVSEAAPM